MGTRSTITVKMAEDKFHSIYCHFDGYLSHNGIMLITHYNSQEMAEKLIAPGDMSVIYQNCEKPEGHTFDSPKEGYCKYYGRDRGEEGVEAKMASTNAQVMAGRGEEFNYLWDGSQWLVTSGHFDERDYLPVTDALSKYESDEDE